MVKIRLKRNQKRNNAFFQIVVADSKTKRDGKYIEKVGYYDPHKKEFPKFKLDLERINYWVSQGAQLTETVEKFVKIEKTGIHFNKNTK
jgi:small subunit ribosomal protein S16